MGNPPTLPIPACPYCGTPARLVERTFRVRRGHRVLPVETWIWQCAAPCAGDEPGRGPFRFTDPGLSAVHDGAIRAAWLARFGEPLPPSERGSRPSEARQHRFQLLLTDAEWAEIEARRGVESRAAYVRRVLFRDRHAR